MAVASINNMVSIGDISHECTTWEFYKPNKLNPFAQNDLLFKSTKDRYNKTKLNFAPRNLDGTLYDPLDGIIGRVKVYYNGLVSDWETIKVKG